MLRGYNLLMIAAIGILVALNLRQCSRTSDVESAMVAAKADAAYWRDQNSHANAEILVLKADKDLIEKTYADLADSLKKENIKLRDTKRVVTVNTQTTDTIRVDVPHFTSEWLDYQWLDSKTLSLSVRDSIALVTYNKPYGFLGLRTKYVTRAISYNPHAVLTGITSIEIVPKRRAIGFGFYGGYGLTVTGGIVRVGPQFGFGIHIRI